MNKLIFIEENLTGNQCVNLIMNYTLDYENLNYITKAKIIL